MNAPSRHTRHRQTFLEVISTVGPRRPVAIHSSQQLAVWMADSVQARQGLVDGLARISWQGFGYRIESPTLPFVTARVAAGQEGSTVDAMTRRLADFDVSLDRMLGECPFFGRVNYVGQHECVFTYFDSATRHGLIQTRHEIVRHEHHLIRVRERKLTDDDVSLPRRQRRIVRMIPSEFHPQLRVVTGTLILKRDRDAGVVTHDHAIGRALRTTGRAVASYGTQSAAGAVIGAAAVGTAFALFQAAASAIGAAAVLAVADPAIVIGDLVISGWLEAEVQGE